MSRMDIMGNLDEILNNLRTRSFKCRLDRLMNGKRI